MATSDTLPAAGRPVAGVLWMLATGFCFVAVTALVKHGAQDLPAVEAAFLRFAFGLLFMAPALLRVAGHAMSPRLGALFVLRGLVHAAAVVLWFYAMTQITIAEVTAMNYLNPIFVTLGAALILGETFARRRQAAILVAFVGAIVILRPGLREIGPGHVAMLAAALLLGVSYLSAKALADRVPAGEVVAMMSLVVTLCLAPIAWLVWVPPSLAEVGWMFGVAIFATGGHYTMTRALAAAPVTVTQPVTFLQLIWATLLGWAVFGEAIDPYVILGGVMILGAAIFITLREAMLSRRPTVKEMP